MPPAATSWASCLGGSWCVLEINIKSPVYIGVNDGFICGVNHRFAYVFFERWSANRRQKKPDTMAGSGEIETKF